MEGLAMPDIFQQVGDVPPVKWVLELGLWHYPPFTWVGDLLNLIFGQQALQWMEGRFAWLVIMTFAMVFLGFEMLWWLWSWVRAHQIGFDEYKARKWTSGPNEGQLKKKPIDLKKARVRRFAWPLLGLPLALVAVGMYTMYLLWPSEGCRVFLALAWFLFAPVRRTMSIWVARKAYRENHPNDQLKTTLREDVFNYFYVGVSRPPTKKREIEPPFEDTGLIWRLLNWGHATFSRYGTFWRILRFWNFLRFWGLLVQAVIAFFWPIAALAAPFFYMWGAEDYEDWVNPWWRRYRKNEYHGRVVKGTVVKKGDVTQG